MTIGHIFNKTCTIEVKTSAFDSVTREQEPTWADFATGVPCRLDMARQGEKRTNTEIYSRSTHLLFIEFREDLDYSNHRIVVGSKTYNILQISDAGGAQTHTELDLEIVES
ncbi:hypothetical protein LCGC14_2335970 [marine sediment metagenome]|uniref:Phage head-tail adaptor n=1 Tax=marine sediment metagenome TaxID=412755 RepID=A0A0F9ER94_9ZZZZ